MIHGPSNVKFISAVVRHAFNMALRFPFLLPSNKKFGLHSLLNSSRDETDGTYKVASNSIFPFYINTPVNVP